MYEYDWSWSVLRNPAFQELLLSGVRTTCFLTLLCIVVGTPLGVLLGSVPFATRLRSLHSFHKTTKSRETGFPIRRYLRQLLTLSMRGVSAACVVFIDIVRAIPLLMLILLFYYGIPALLAATLFRLPIRDVSAFTAVALAMALNLAAFIADVVRGATSAVARGDILAAQSLGMGTAVLWRRIILPQVTREVLPSINLLYITMLKLSTLGSVVGVYEVLHSADAIVQRTYRPLELYVTVTLLFILMVLPLAAYLRRLERSAMFLRRPGL